MTISELIKAFEDLADKYGDVYVEMSNGRLVASVEPMRHEDSDEVTALIK